MAAWTPPSLGNAVWFDIPAVDVAGCKKFYATLFPTWTWRPVSAAGTYSEEDLAMFTMGPDVGALSGGISKVLPSTKEASAGLELGVGVTLYHLVSNIDETKKQIEALGGTIVKEKTKEGESGWYLFAKDVEGNRFGIYEFLGMDA